MDNCSKHKKEVAGISDMKVLAEMIGDLNYESLSELFLQLWHKFKKDAEADYKGGRHHLSDYLEMTAMNIEKCHKHVENAWKISQPFMTDNSQKKQQ